MKKEEIQPIKVDISYILSTLWSFVSVHKKYFFGVIFFTFITEMVSFTDNFVFKYLVDKATLFAQNSISESVFANIIFYTVLFYFGLRFIDSLGWFIRIRLMNKLDGNVMSDVERKSFWHVLSLSYRYHLNKKTGSMISQFTRGVSKVESLIDAFLFQFFPVIFRLIFSISVIFYFDTTTAIILIIMVIFFISFGVFLTNKQKKPQAVANAREDILKQNLSDVFVNIETVKYFGKEKSTYSYFQNLSKKLLNSRFDFWNYFSLHAGIQTFILGTGIAAIFYFSFNSFLNGNITLGSITLIYAAVWKLLPQLFGLIHGYREFIRSTVDISALFETFKEKNEVLDTQNAKPIQVKQGVISYENVLFTYPEKQAEKQPALKEFNLHVKKNTKVALVGPSGSGKTTVIKLLYRLFDLHEGKISIDGQDISKVTQESLRNSMSIVPQEPLLFDNTIYFNIAYANPKATKKQVWQAIKSAKLDQFIQQLPQKENTIVGERGVKLSGGEKQRVSIARALLANKKILILDEATSALDSETEKEIQKSLEKLMQGRTTIIIAHRLSTIMKADTIVVMKKGKILELGTHAQLKRKTGGLYKRLWQLQQGGEL